MNEFFSSRPNFPSQFYGLVGTFWVVVLSMFIFQSGCLSNTLALACEFWQLTFTLQSEEKMDDVLKSGHFSILTISICSRTCVCTKCVFTSSSLSTITTPILYFSSPFLPDPFNQIGHFLNPKKPIYFWHVHDVLCPASDVYS